MSPQIHLAYGDHQAFRSRYRELTVPGSFTGALPAKRATWSLDGGPDRPFYVESVSGLGVDYSFQYKASPARLRLPHLGEFNIEVPVDEPSLSEPGGRVLRIRIVGADGVAAERAVEIEWDPTPPTLPLEVADLSEVGCVQEIGQVVDGGWDIDRDRSVIRSRAPAAPDSLLLLGPQARSQEAEYEWRYLDGSRSKYVGFSDFFVGHEVEDPSIPVKPGWSTAGLATSRPRGEGVWEARIWIARGDRPGWRPTDAASEESETIPRLVRTEPAVIYPLQERRWYRVRHQVRFGETEVVSAFRVWPSREPEPVGWLCEEGYPHPHGKPPFESAAFGLFQHSGLPSEWRAIRLARL